MRIFLIGFMGSGKSTMGKQLANRLQYKFIDQDEWIEKKTGLSVKDFFAVRGEAEFRKLEHESLAEISKEENVVVSTGGGAPCFHGNIDLMNESGITVYLNMKPEVLFSRLRNGQETRPLIKNKTDVELMDYIKSKLVERTPFYSKAKIILESMSLKPDDILLSLKHLGYM